MLRLYCPDFVKFLYLYGGLQIQFINHNAVYQQLFWYLTSRNYFADISPLSAYHLQKYLVCLNMRTRLLPYQLYCSLIHSIELQNHNTLMHILIYHINFFLEKKGSYFVSCFQ